MRVYAVLVSFDSNTVGVNLKDSTLPSKLAAYEGLIGLFGGAIEPGETSKDALVREIREEIPGFLPELESGNFDNVTDLGVRYDELMKDHYHLYAVLTDLSGHRKTRATDRIGQLSRVFLEGDAVVRTSNYIRSCPPNMFVSPTIKQCILDALVIRNNITK